MSGREQGFPPVYNGQSEVLILGSFPSVMSREEGFYYGNPRNRFWHIVCSFFGEDVPPDPPSKTDFLLRRHIALWDMVCSCEIEGSRDESIEGEELAPVGELIERLPVRTVLCNGAAAYRLFLRADPAHAGLARRMPSTSPRNAGCKNLTALWHAALAQVFGDFSKRG